MRHVGIALKSEDFALIEDAEILQSITCGFKEVGYSPKGTSEKKFRRNSIFLAEGFFIGGFLIPTAFFFNFLLGNKQYAKFVFDCQLLMDNFKKNQEIAELEFFDIKNLPPLSEKRITKEQMEILWQVYQGERINMSIVAFAFILRSTVSFYNKIIRNKCKLSLYRAE